ncbi:MAG: hypothetical protein ABI782_01380 [Anaerolineaceae bacterium]
MASRTAPEPPAARAEPSLAGRRLNGLLCFLPVVIGCLAATLLYWPALDAPFYADDYIYLRAASLLSWPDYLHAAVVPYTSDPVLLLTNNFWRPLYFLSFKALEPVFGDNVAPYHRLLLGIHFAGIVMVWALAMRLSGKALAAWVATIVFAVHPAGVESVAWVSSLNSAALPCALGAWLVFAVAVESPHGARRRWLAALCLCLLVLAAGFRETAIVAVIAMGAWYLLVPARARLREPRAWMPVVALVAFCVGYEILRTRFLTGPFTSPPQYELGTKIPGNAWKMVRYGLVPFSTEGQPLLFALSNAGGILLFAVLAGALLTRRWLLAALLIGFFASVLPFAPLRAGLGARYFYFPSAFLALALGQAGVELGGLVRPRFTARATWIVAGVVMAAVLVAFASYGNHRVRQWESETGAGEQVWVAALRAQYPTLPPGGTLYCVNTPLVLALFGDYNLYPTVSYLYPRLGAAKRIDESQVAAVTRQLGPNDRVFVYRGK